MQSVPGTKVIIVFFLLLCKSTFHYSQIISNMSFEGTPQGNIPPEGWTPCNEFSTPDTQPGFWEVTTQPSHGNTYLGMVTRGNLGPYANINEDIQTELSTPLSVGEVYNLTVDLSYSPDWGHTIDFGSTFLRYDTPAKLELFSGSSACEKVELLWESPPIDDPEWKSYHIELNPKSASAHYLIIQANYTGDSTYFGNILIDNIVNCSIDIDLELDTTICQNEPFVVDATIPGGKYKWHDGSTNSNYTIEEAGVYSVLVSNQCVSEFYEITVQTRNCLCDTAHPIETQPFDTLICENKPTLIDASTPGGIYQWSTGSTHSAITVQSAGVFTVDVSNGCKTKHFEFFVGQKDCRCEIEVPNFFSPNGDHINETFEITGSSDIARFNLMVFNRYGKLVYQTGNMKNYWRGDLNGKELPPGVYYWIIDIMCIWGNEIVDNSFKGWIALSR